MMNREQAVEFAASSADMAVDQACAFPSVQDAVASYRENVRDTLKDERAAEFEPEAFDAFDARIAQITARK